MQIVKKKHFCHLIRKRNPSFSYNFEKLDEIKKKMLHGSWELCDSLKRASAL